MFGTYDVFYANRGEDGYQKAQVGDEGDAVGIALVIMMMGIRMFTSLTELAETLGKMM